MLGLRRPMRYNSPVPRTLPLLLLTACAEWPRYEHLDGAGDPDAIPAGSDPADAVEIEWLQGYPETEGGTANGLPITTITPLGPNQGVVISGVLDGSGWDGDSPPDRDGECGELAFPYDLEGSYAGDVDWAAVQPEAVGYLCATIEIDHPSARYDLVPYRLDDCQEPEAALVDEESRTWGYGLEGDTATWAAPVADGKAIGVVLAAFWPQDGSARIPWRLGLSHTNTGPCPSLPEAE